MSWHARFWKSRAAGEFSACSAPLQPWCPVASTQISVVAHRPSPILMVTQAAGRRAGGAGRNRGKSDSGRAPFCWDLRRGKRGGRLHALLFSGSTQGLFDLQAENSSVSDPGREREEGKEAWAVRCFAPSVAGGHVIWAAGEHACASSSPSSILMREQHAESPPGPPWAPGSDVGGEGAVSLARSSHRSSLLGLPSSEEGAVGGALALALQALRPCWSARAICPACHCRHLLRPSFCLRRFQPRHVKALQLVSVLGRQRRGTRRGHDDRACDPSTEIAQF